jgi:hypothetical protein
LDSEWPQQILFSFRCRGKSQKIGWPTHGFSPKPVWKKGRQRIKFSYETGEPLSMSTVQALTMASYLHKIGEIELADEIDDAIKNAVRYASM